MLLLEKVHPSIQAAVDRVLAGANKTPTTVVRDFDGCEYHIRVERQQAAAAAAGEGEGDGNSAGGQADQQCCASVTVALRHTTPFNELDAHHNFDEVLSTLFPPPLRKFLKSDTFGRSSGEFVVEIRIPAAASERTRCEALQAAGQLRIWSYIPVFARQCEVYLTRPELVKPMLLHYHAGEEMLLFSHKGSFLVLVALRVASKDEAVFTRHFLQTMMDAKKLQREISAAPAFAFDHGKVPDSMPKGMPVACGSDPCVFWCSFQLFRRQMEPMEHLVETVTQLVNFRSTLAYHIHAGRTYMHSMMRKRVEMSLQVLNRAKTKTTGKAKIALQ
ncbi:ARP2/3 complex subunit [Trypanosoma grayi]|uniref:ARP2/3 complex subunit n=1 Tax=Trypanosoma grayi TaxID=71804 RepID=UPI0004F44A71|nr:ARP2/3 complex subunit [Trypanosoma grayi]KEG10929.1 ARP2/3 complex subunit [Trypanosoma grayi]